MKKPWEKCNKPYVLTLQFLQTANVKAFAGPRPTKHFFGVYNFFKKPAVEVLDLFHEYMDETGKQPGLSMSDLFYKAAAWNREKRTTKITETHVEDYLALLKEL